MKGQPFFFDKNIFDEDAPPSPAAEEEAPVEFTRDDLENAKNQSFEEGKKAGFQDAEQGKVQAILDMLKNLEKQMAAISSAEDDRHKIYEEDAVHLSLCILQKLFPVFNKAYGIEELKTALQSALSAHATPNNLRIELHDKTAAELQKHIEKLEEETQKTLCVVTSPDLHEQEFRISWPEGGIINNREKIAQKAFDLITEALAERGINVHHDDEILNNTPDDNQDAPEPNSTGDL